MNFSSMTIYATESEVSATYFPPDSKGGEFVSISVENARGRLTRWEEGSVTMEAEVSEHVNGSLYLSPAAARELAGQILAALPDETVQKAEAA